MVGSQNVHGTLLQHFSPRIAAVGEKSPSRKQGIVPAVDLMGDRMTIVPRLGKTIARRYCCCRLSRFHGRLEDEREQGHPLLFSLSLSRLFRIPCTYFLHLSQDSELNVAIYRAGEGISVGKSGHGVHHAHSPRSLFPSRSFSTQRVFVVTLNASLSHCVSKIVIMSVLLSPSTRELGNFVVQQLVLLFSLIIALELIPLKLGRG